jgi:hypothetical protein
MLVQALARTALVDGVALATMLVPDGPKTVSGAGAERGTTLEAGGALTGSAVGAEPETTRDVTARRMG